MTTPTALPEERIADLLERASHMLIDDGLPVERCALSKALVLKAAAELRAAQAENTALRARDIGWKMECEELRASLERMKAVAEAARKQGALHTESLKNVGIDQRCDCNLCNSVTALDAEGKQQP